MSPELWLTAAASGLPNERVNWVACYTEPDSAARAHSIPTQRRFGAFGVRRAESVVVHTPDMAQPNEIADRALALASSFLADATKEIVAMSDGDFNALYEAAQDVKNRATGHASEHSVEHLAFSLITAAHTQLRA